MSEKIYSLKFIQEAFKFEFRLRDESRYENDDYPMSGLEKFQFIIATLVSKSELRSIIQAYSSYNYGAFILTSIFPKSENPEDYHSRGGSVSLDEHPVQVLGWADEERLIKEGVESGLDKNYITIGFESEAEKRGIDLEWSFFENAPTTDNSHQLDSGQ